MKQIHKDIIESLYELKRQGHNYSKSLCHSVMEYSGKYNLTDKEFLILLDECESLGYIRKFYRHTAKRKFINYEILIDCGYYCYDPPIPEPVFIVKEDSFNYDFDEIENSNTVYIINKTVEA